MNVFYKYVRNRVDKISTLLYYSQNIIYQYHSKSQGSEYMWAADDYVMFKRLMIKHNLDLELQTANYFSLKTDQSSSELIFIDW